MGDEPFGVQRLEVDVTGLEHFGELVVEDAKGLAESMSAPADKNPGLASIGLPTFNEARYVGQVNMEAYTDLIDFVSQRLFPGMVNGGMGATLMAALYTNTDVLNGASVGHVQELLQAQPGQAQPVLGEVLTAPADEQNASVLPEGAGWVVDPATNQTLGIDLNGDGAVDTAVPAQESGEPTAQSSRADLGDWLAEDPLVETKEYEADAAKIEAFTDKLREAAG